MTASNIKGLSAFIAISNDGAICSGSSTLIPSSPNIFAYSAYLKSGTSCDASNFGSPAKTRCSQVTIFRSRLFKTSIINFGLDHFFQYLAMVIISFIPIICIAPSPTNATGIFSGQANFAAIA